MGSLRIVGGLVALVLLTGCWPRHQFMKRQPDATFPGSRGDAERYVEELATWTRIEPLGLRSTASVTLFDPALGAVYLAHHARRDGREVGPAELPLWETMYGERQERLPFHVKWSFDKLFQPQRVTQPRSGWRFSLRDDHGRRWEPLAIEQIEQGETTVAWTGSFWVYFPTRDLQVGPLFDGRTRKLTLRIQGEPGWSDFSWRFAPDPGAHEEPWPDRR